MKFKFKAKTKTKAPSYTISAETINGLDLSIIEHGGRFTPTEATRAAGVFHAWRDEAGELFAVLAQATTGYRIPVRSHDWVESDWIDAADYDPARCYVKPTAPELQKIPHRLVQVDGCWTVEAVEEEAEDA